MGLDKKVLRTRGITAIVFAAVMLLGLLTNVYSFISLFAFVAIGCIVELWRLARKQTTYSTLGLGLLGTIFIFFAFLFFIFTGITILPMGAPPILNYFAILPCCIIFSIWINDTMAYIVGSLIGKTPLSKVSPKKTIEGTVGGALLAVIIIGCLFQYLPFDTSNISSIFNKVPFFNIGFGLVAAVAAIFGTIGDLAESKLKRIANVKDSGSFMPGHGGFLDRFDSLLLAGPVCFLVLRLLGLGV